MKKYTVYIVLSVLLTGCSFQFDPVAKKAETGSAVFVKSLGESEGIITAIEDATGKTLPTEIIVNGKNASETAEKIARSLQAASSIAAAIPGPQQPFAGSLTTILGAIAGLAAGATAFFKRRAKRNEKAVDSIVKAAEEWKEAPEKITSSARDNGVADYVHSRHIEINKS